MLARFQFRGHCHMPCHAWQELWYSVSIFRIITCWLVGWSLLSLFSTHMAISETRIITCMHCSDSTLRMYCFSIFYIFYIVCSLVLINYRYNSPCINTYGDSDIISSYHIYASCFPSMMWASYTKCLLL